jgi:hypothetical protein
MGASRGWAKIASGTRRQYPPSSAFGDRISAATVALS